MAFEVVRVALSVVYLDLIGVRDKQATRTTFLNALSHEKEKLSARRLKNIGGNPFSLNV